jgi:hypothetical protein
MNDTQRKPAWFWARLGAGLIMIVAGAIVSRAAFEEWGHDFAPQYVSAWMLREGKNPYDFAVQNDGYMRHVGSVTTWANFYPPSAAVAALPATFLPYPVARELWFVVTFTIMLVGLWRFMAVFLPKWDTSMRVLVLGLICSAATTRWAFKVAQPGPVVLGLFAVFLAELKQRRTALATACGALIVCAKVTFGIPFFLVSLALRRVGILGAMLGVCIVLNVIGLFGMGGPAIIPDYRANLAQFERPDELNYPDPRGSNSLARTDWPYLLNAIDPSNFARSNLLGHVLTLAVTAWLAVEAWRLRHRLNETNVLLALAAAVAPLSMLAVYHHHYDMGILLLPVLFYLGRPELRKLPGVWAYVVPVVLYTGFYPYAKFASWLRTFMGDNEVLISRPLACVVCIVALGGSLAVLRSVVRESAVEPSAEPELAAR